MEYQLTDKYTEEAINILIIQTSIPSEYEMNKAVDNIKDIISSHFKCNNSIFTIYSNIFYSQLFFLLFR